LPSILSSFYTHAGNGGYGAELTQPTQYSAFTERLTHLT
jgi:hypothetical protein